LEGELYNITIAVQRVADNVANVRGYILIWSKAEGTLCALHCTAQDPPCKEERVNLTFRTMYTHDQPEKAAQFHVNNLEVKNY
jgi:hypothetical protein